MFIRKCTITGSIINRREWLRWRVSVANVASHGMQFCCDPIKYVVNQIEGTFLKILILIFSVAEIEVGVV